MTYLDLSQVVYFICALKLHQLYIKLFNYWTKNIWKQKNFIKFYIWTAGVTSSSYQNI